MAVKREKLFDCTFSSGVEEFAHCVSAWSPEAAEQQFLAELSSAGIHGPGTIQVRTLRGSVAREHRFVAHPK